MKGTILKFFPLIGVALFAITVVLSNIYSEPASGAATLSENIGITNQGAETAQLSDSPGTSGSELYSPESLVFIIDNLWVLMAAALVLLMHLGFATVESGLTQSKNSVNVIYKNVFILCTGLLTYAFVGYQIMYPGDFNGFLGFGGFGIGFDPSNPAGMLTQAGGNNTTIWTDFIFQGMFAATAATIVSGCVTGRIKLPAFMIFGTLLVAISYPVTGSWLWGGGWLSELGFHDFAGSTLVHGVGGAAGLACVLLLGARKGKFENGKIYPIPGHSIPLATIGVFLLWVGWFGFNGGSVLSANPAQVSYVFVTTALASCAGALASMITTHLTFKSLDASMALNGILAGLVGITAGADIVTPMSAVVIGAVAGVIVVFAIHFFDRIKIDDPVGAISVHGVCGVWGTLAVAIFVPGYSLLVQLAGILSVLAFTFIFSLTVFAIIRATMGVRVSDQVEDEGLDISEHGNSAYPYFAGVNLTRALTEKP